MGSCLSAVKEALHVEHNIVMTTLLPCLYAEQQSACTAALHNLVIVEKHLIHCMLYMQLLNGLGLDHAILLKFCVYTSLPCIPVQTCQRQTCNQQAV